MGASRHASHESILASACALVDVYPIHLGRHRLAGLGILVGFKIRWAAAALVVFCLGTAFGVHLAAGDFNNMIHFYKNLVMAGGFLYVMTYGAGAMSIDGVDEA